MLFSLTPVLTLTVEEGFWVGVGVEVMVLLRNPKNPLLFFWVWTGVGVKAEVDLLFRLSLPVITAKKTKITTNPKTKEITLLKLSI